ncbi:CorA family divalent cation transporter [Streptomyces klenkii]|uniref:CorA family divalent cation transporter n=1 Tax=Streptomyces klenkii TaxID=1420899 RepID=UPI00342D4656
MSSWVAILFAATLVGTSYGMHFGAMPELRWAFGCRFAIRLTAVVCEARLVVGRRGAARAAPRWLLAGDLAASARQGARDAHRDRED